MDPGSSNVKLGLRVVRGPDWNYGDDHLEGLVGTVVEIGGQNGSEAPENSVVVVWDTGVKGRYRTGHGGSYDLRAFDNIQCGVFHFQSCNGCRERGIHGFKWTCASCNGISLCTACYMSDQHDISHPFIMWETRLSYGIGVPPRRECHNDKQLAKGIFQGALVVRGLNWNADNQDGGDGNTGLVVKVSKWGEYTVRWTTGASYVYRMGKDGAVNLKFVGPGFGGYYYKSHLPVVGQLNDQTLEKDFARNLQITTAAGYASDNPNGNRPTTCRRSFHEYRNNDPKKKTQTGRKWFESRPAAVVGAGQTAQPALKRDYMKANTSQLRQETPVLEGEDKVKNAFDRSNLSLRDEHGSSSSEMNQVRPECTPGDPMNSAVVRQALDMDIPKHLVESCVKKRLEDNQGEFASIESLMEAVFNDIINESAPSLKYASSATSTTSTSDQLAEEIQKLKDERLCKICLEEDACATFLPCGHLACCLSCGLKLKDCLICRSRIQSCVRTYIA